MGLMKTREGTGGAQFEVVETVTPYQLVKVGELPSGTVVYDAQTKQRVDPNSVLQPGRSYGNTVQAQYGG